MVCSAYLDGIAGGVALVYWRNLLFYMAYFLIVGIFFGIFHFYELHKSSEWRKRMRVKTIYAMFITIFAVMILHGVFVWYYAW